MVEEKGSVEPVQIATEIGEIGELIRAAFGEVADRLGFTRENSPTFPAFVSNEKLLSQLDRPEARCMGIREAGKWVGFVAIAPYGDDSEIARLAVLPECRHRVYGKLLMDAACEAARAMGIAEIGLGMVNENTVLKKWYEAQGFVAGEPFAIPNAAFTACPMSKLLAP